MHPLFGADLASLTRLLLQNGPVSIANTPIALAVGLSALGRLPFTLGERGMVAWKKRHMAPMPAPIFIIGHWRSGTTHLYNLLTRSSFGYVAPIAAGMPHEFLTLGRWLRPWLIKMLPKTRYVDQMEVRPDSPQEDEIPIGSMSPISFYHGVYFPKRFDQHFRRSMFLDGCTPTEIERWKSAFTRFIDKCWLDHDRRLVIKNPTYTCRIPHIRDLYPDARFVHIYRNPHDVFRSTRRFYLKLLKQFAWQNFDHLDIDGFVLEGYQRMMEQLGHDKAHLPDNRFAEIRFEDLDCDPLKEIRRIYAQLELGDTDAVEPAIQEHLERVAGFRKTAFEPCEEQRTLVEQHWGPFIDRFGYRPAKAETPS